MTSTSPPKSSRVKMCEDRERLRRQGLVPDVRSPAFRAEAHRQSLMVASAASEAEDQAFVDALTDWGED